MASIETLQASFDRFEREQKIRDNGLLRAFDMFTNAVKRLQETIEANDADQQLPMAMPEFMRMIAMMLDRQRQLLESIGEHVEDGSWLDDENEHVHPPKAG